MKNIAIVLCNGKGARFGSKIPKQFMSLNGKPVVQYVIDAIEESKIIDYIILVGKSKYWTNVKINLPFKIIEGGSSRNESVIKGIEYAKHLKGTNIIIFDSVRPLITSKHITNIIKELDKGESAVITTQKITDALIKIKNNYLEDSLQRDYYKITQTPDAFKLDILKNFHTKQIQTGTTSGNLVDCRVKCLDFEGLNLKITHKKDLFYAEKLINYKEVLQREPKLKGQKILVLGGSGGIGNEVVKKLKKYNVDLYYPSREELNLSKISDSYYLKEEWDCIINCAGVNCIDKDISYKKFKEVFDINVWVTLYILLYAKTKNVILIGSTSASFGREGISLYSASKSALNSLVESLSHKDKKVNIICPANVNTKMQDYVHPNSDKTKYMSPKKIADIILRYINVDFSGHIVYIKEGLEEVT